jgi:hypothetical protein
MRKTIVALIVVFILGLAPLGWLLYISRDARRFDEAQVSVTIRGTPAVCKVSPRSEKEGQVVSCGSVADYFRNQLHLPRGTKFYLVAGGDSRRADLDAVGLALKESGYRSVGTMAAFIVEPKRAEKHQ